MKYKDEIMRANEMLAKNENTIVVGQSVCYAGHAMSPTVKFWDDSRKIETPVFEDTQMGMCTGLSLAGYIPISIYPRWNFLLLATNQLVNHLDKMKIISHGDFNPKVIIRVAVGSESPLFPGHQHVGSFLSAFKLMCKTVVFEDLQNPEDIYPAYERAINRDCSTVLSEVGDYYYTK